MVEIDDLSERIQAIANKDGVITAEEEELLKKINNFIRQYKLYQRQAEEDGVIDEQEYDRLNEMRKGILEGTWVAANEDGNITDDESNLISIVYEFIKELKL